MAGDAGLILACAGCCCGHPAHSGALAPQRTLKATARRIFKASGLDGRVRLVFTECLGPCSEAGHLRRGLFANDPREVETRPPGGSEARATFCR